MRKTDKVKIMTLLEYEAWFKDRVRMYGAEDIHYLSTKLGEEAGEVGGKVCKVIRDDIGHWVTPSALLAYIMDRPTLRRRIAEELGDTFWYTIRIANLLGFTSQEILAIEAEKIEGRQERGTDHGSGDDR